jgi:hypothetical protein
MKKESTRNMTLSTKVAPEQKAEYLKIAQSNRISVSEWAASIIEMNKNSYNQFGEPTQEELIKDMKIRKLELETNRLGAKLESADFKVNFEMERGNKAIHERDKTELENKKLKTEVKQLKTKIMLLESTEVYIPESIVTNSPVNFKFLTAGIAILTAVIGFSFGQKL